MPEERKLVTILFADVTGSTALGDAMDPEDVRALMSRYYGHARRVVAAHGGTIEKFIGDAVMAVFGLVQAHGDDPERALAAALALRDAIAGDAVLGPEFRLRMGVNTGEVVATGDPSSGDFLITGDAVNVAARIEQHANPGEIMASERTADAARTAFTFAEPRSIEVKGKPLPLRVYPVVGTQTVRQAERPPLVGRRQDLLQLELLKERAVEERRPQLVSIIAPAGTGKTRLLEEFLARLDSAEGFRVATARCLPYGQTLTYWPLRGLLANLLDAEPARSAVAAIFAQGGYSADDAGRLADRVLATLGVEADAEADRESIFMAWRLLLEVFARQAPRVIIFEDLHWASESLLDLVEHVIHFCTDAPLVMIALSRPELLDQRPTWGGGWKNFTALTLQPLTAAQTRELVGKILAQLLDDTRERIVERSGGNPFFALELVRGVSERLQSGGSAADALPDTVHAAVLARLDLLTHAERAVLQVASVAGRAFKAEMIRAVLPGIGQHEMEHALADLAGRDLLVPQEGSNFAFRHILIRDVAYGTLSRPERIRIHAALGVWLEETAGERQDELVDLIAYHYREAILLARQSAVPLDVPIDPARAVRALRRAGELAGRAGAFAEARSHLQAAIQLAPESERMSLYELLGDNVFLGHIAYQAYRDALECWRASGASGTADPLTGARIFRKLLTTCLRGFVPEAREYSMLAGLYEEGRALAEAAGDPDEIWRVRLLHPFLEVRPQHLTPEQAGPLRAEALTAADHFAAQADWTSFSTALDAYTSLSAALGDYDAVRNASQRRLTVGELPAIERGDAVGMLILSYYMKGDYAGCIAAIREQLAQRRAGEPLTYLALGVSVACGSAFCAGLWDDLNSLLPTLISVWEQVQSDASMANTLLDGFVAALSLGVAREDRAASDAAFSALTRDLPPEAATMRAIFTAIRDDSPESLASALADMDPGGVMVILILLNEHGTPASREAIARLRTRPQRIDVDVRCAAIAEALANDDNAALAVAIDEADRHNLVVHAARMRIVLAQRTGDRTQLDRARVVLERLQDRMSLRRLEEVAASIG